MNQLVNHDRDSGYFANAWSRLLFLSHTYNFITAWYFLGLAGFPDGTWLVFELTTEVIIFCDLCITIYLKKRMPNQWRTMWLLHSKQQDPSIAQYVLITIASIPQSLILSIVFGND